MKKHRSKKLKHYWWTYWWVWFFLYFVIWFSFGWEYCQMANNSSGEDFVFQEDILIKSKNIDFQNQVGVKLDYDITKKLIANYKKDFTPLIMGAEDTPLVIFNYNSNGYSPIGSDWANYYWAKLVSQGYNSFDISIIKKNDSIVRGNKYTKVRIGLNQLPKRMFNHDISIESNDLTKESIGETKEYFIWLPNEFFDEKDPLVSTFYKENVFHPIELIRPILVESINYLDKDINIIYNFETKKKFNYPLMDFLYFSAVSITTLGYGDILPNSSAVRELVMTEALFGVFTLTMFLSCSYDRIKEVKKKNSKRNNNILDVL